MAYTFAKGVEFNPILPDLPKQGWKYSLHGHKNQNGIHYDLMLSPPNQIIAYSWSTKTLPFRGKKTKAFRTRDKLKDDMGFEGQFVSGKGYINTKKLLVHGDASIQSIGDRGLVFETKDGVFQIKNIKDKKYMILRQK